MARKSRSIIETAKPKYRVWRIAIYIRLSKEDARCFDESESVTNQRKIIEDHITEFNDGDEYMIVDEYVDDGISGTTDDERDDFQRMLSDIKRGRINCVIVKDLARSFRNYSDQGYYLDDWFVRYLNDHGILCPSLYKRECLGLKYQNPQMNMIKRPLWCAMTITSILKNRMYCGDMVQGRYRIKSYKVHVQETVPKDEWYIVENTHEAIIDRETFEKVQRLLLWDTRTGPQQNKLYLFSGFLKCADCGKSMTRSKVGDTVYYYCRTYKDQSKGVCTKHTIRHDRLEAAVLYAIRQQVYLAVDYSKTIEWINRAPL